MNRPSQGRRRRRKFRHSQGRRRRQKAAAQKPFKRGMSVKELAKLTGKSLKTTYKKVNAGFYPSIRLGRGQITVLTEPTLEILRGLRQPGPLPGMLPAATAPAGAQEMLPELLPDRPDSVVKKRQRKRRPKRSARSRRKSKSRTTPKAGEATPIAP